MQSKNQREKLTSSVGTVQKKVIASLGNPQATMLTREEFMHCYDELIDFFRTNNLSRDDQEFFIKWYDSTLDDYYKNIVLPQLQQKTEEPLLDEFFKQWNHFKIFVSMMKKILTWLDTNAFPTLVKMSLTVMSFAKFRTKIYEFMSTKMFNTIYDFFDKERGKDVVPRNTIKKMIEIYETLGSADFKVDFADGEFTLNGSGGTNQYYIKFFEKNLVERIKIHFKAKSEQWLLLSVPEYVTEATNALNFEDAQADFYYPKSKQLIRNAIINEIVTTHSEKLVNNQETGVFKMLEKKKNDELIKIYDLMAIGVPTDLTVLSKAYSNYIEKTGLKIVEESKTSKDPAFFTSKVIELKKNMDQVGTYCFHSNYDFQQSRDLGFKTFINGFKKSPTLLSYFLDFQFTKGIKGLSETEIEDMLVYFTKIITYLSSKDEFISFHKKLLSKRLLNNSSLSFDSERNLVSKLSDECGPASVNAITTMLVEITSCEEQKKQFSSLKPNNPLEVLVCSSTWPNLVGNPLAKLPKEMENYCKEFEQFYKQLPMYQSKKITWVLSEGKGEVTATFGKTRYILDVKSYQIGLLLRFNEAPKYTFSELKELTGINEALLSEYLVIFTNQVPVLGRKDASKKDQAFSDEEEIFINFEFKNEKRKIPCFSNRSGRSEAEKKNLIEGEDAQKQLEQERELALDAMIVRIMKSRRLLKYIDLLAEINKLSTLFQPQPNMIRKRIDSLIERDYLKREEGSPNVLVYLP
mmetsp:Transcript_82159/g.96082  ORF Transcript_82159/g.96082 Transcript_82159/m.96082 type:complete len:748 (+) Transcript_82159:46-2289(+)